MHGKSNRRCASFFTMRLAIANRIEERGGLYQTVSFYHNVTFPLIEDIRMEVANKYGMIQPGQSNTQAVRAVFVIDRNGVVRTILYYPLSTGRNFDEIKRIVLALQKADADACATPADWRPGDDVIVPTAGSCGVAKERMDNQNENQYCLDWFMCFRKESK